MKENYTYAAILDYSEEGFVNISFPDFPGTMTCAERDAGDVIESAQDVLCLALCDCLDEGRTPPEPGVYEAVTQDQKVVFVNVWMPYHRSKVKEVFVKKTLTIPSWLNVLAQQNGINFSSVLTEALRAKLGIGSRGQ